MFVHQGSQLAGVPGSLGTAQHVVLCRSHLQVASSLTPLTPICAFVLSAASAEGGIPRADGAVI